MRKAERRRNDTMRRASSHGALPEVPDNNPQRCQQCNGVGHNRRTCQEILRFCRRRIVIVAFAHNRKL